MGSFFILSLYKYLGILTVATKSLAFMTRLVMRYNSLLGFRLHKISFNGDMSPARALFSPLLACLPTQTSRTCFLRRQPLLKGPRCRGSQTARTVRICPCTMKGQLVRCRSFTCRLQNVRTYVLHVSFAPCQNHYTTQRPAQAPLDGGSISSPTMR